MNVLAGSLEHFRPVKILKLLQSVSVTGRLEIMRGGERADLYVTDGRRLFARTNGVSLRIGDILVANGDVRPEAIELVAAMQQDKPGVRLGEMLVRSGVVGPDQVEKAVLQVQRRIVCRVLLWNEGVFRFFWNEAPEVAEDTTLDLEVDEAISLAITLADEFTAPRTRRAA